MIVNEKQSIQEQIARTIVNEYFYQRSVRCGNENYGNPDIQAKEELRTMIVNVLSDPEIVIRILGSFHDHRP